MVSWGDVASWFQKPQAIYTGATEGLNNTMRRLYGLEDDEEELSGIFKDLEEAGVNVSEYEHLRPLAQSVGSGIKEALTRRDVTPSKFIEQRHDTDEWGGPRSGTDIIAGVGSDILQDPLNFGIGSGAASKLAKGTKLAKAAEGFETVGKLEKGAGIGAHAGQWARRLGQGALHAEGDPLRAIQIAGGIGGAEWLGTPLAKAAASRIGRKTATEGAEAAVKELMPGPRVHTSGPASTTNIPENVEVSGTVFDRGTELMSGPKVFESGPVGSTGHVPPFEQLALPRGSAIELGPVPGDVGYSDVLDSVLTRGGTSAPSTQRPDALIRALTTGRRNESGRYMTANQRRMLEQLQNSPDAVGRLMRAVRGQ